jgi:hypothetical protein
MNENTNNTTSDANLRLAASRKRIREWITREPASDTGSDWSPLSLATSLATDAGNEALRPIATRHPYALVGTALAGGALIAWARPWRLLSSALFAGALSQLGARLVSQIELPSMADAVHAMLRKGGADST